MTPADERVIAAPSNPSDVCCLWSPDETIVYLYVATGERAQSGALYLRLNSGLYRMRWYEPNTGDWREEDRLEHPGGPALISVPSFGDDLVLDLTRIE